MNFQIFQSPIGDLFLVEKAGALRFVVFAANWEHFKVRHPELTESGSVLLERVQTQLTEYFAGKRTDFDLPLRLEGTDFQMRVWDALRRIPFGETRSYSEQAIVIRNPKGVRAVGLANGQNPLPVIVPCHRVIGKNGSLTGFAGGVSIKRKLLQLEGQQF